MDTLSFRIPEQHPPTENSFDLRPQMMQRWVEELPMGDMGEAARRLFTMLQQTNALKFSPELRATLLEQVSPAMNSVLDTLLRHYKGLSFPLPQKSVRLARFANSLLSEAVIAHRAVINGYEGASWLFRSTHRHLWLQSIHHMLVYLERILDNYRIVHRPYPEGVWLLLHSCYREAQKQGRHTSKVTWEGSMLLRSSIEQEYKRALLLSLIEPQLFRREQLAEIQATMPRWLEEARLLTPQKKCEGFNAYCIRADEDVPYTVMAELCCEECEKGSYSLLLDLSGLDATIEKVLSQTPDDSPSTTLRGTSTPISRETLETLQQCWRPPQKLREERHRSDKAVEAVIGMSAIYTLMLQEAMEENARGISDQKVTDSLHPLFEKGLPTSLEDADVDWEDTYLGVDLAQNSWAVDADSKNYHFISARELNYTKTGFCLSFSSENIESLQVGELVGFRESQAHPLQLFMVRWLQDGDNTISVGLMRLAQEVEPVLVLLHQIKGGAEQKTAFGCLMGIGEDHLPQLFLPALPGNQHGSFYLAVDDKELPIMLRDKVALSPLFKAYHFIAAESLHVPSTGEEIPLREVNARLHKIAHSEEEPLPSGGDDFKDIWDSI